MPVVRGFPPVTWPTIPGKESDGNGVLARVYSVPRCASDARADRGCVDTYHARSDSCMPSTESSRTCWWVLCGSWERAGTARALAVTANDARPAAAEASATATVLPDRFTGNPLRARPS